MRTGSPFFSVIIPTRNRYETLQYTIRTVLDQDFDSFELIISDNSDPEKLQEAEQIRPYLNDERVRYFRPDSVLAMSDNWEFAVSKATGDFIIIFGDDDGLVSGALKKIHAILQETKRNLVSWARVEYSWPDRAPRQYSNLTVIPYMANTGIMDGKGYITDVIFYRADYRYFPMMYNSAVSRKLIDKLISKTGRLFNAANPDIYTGFAFAHLEKKYLTVGYPLSINGVSAKSNGAAHLSGDHAVMADYWKTFKTSEIKWPRTIPEINSPYLGFIEPFTQLAAFFPELKTYITTKQIYKIIIDTLESTDKQDLEDKLQKMLLCAENDKALHTWLAGYIRKAAPQVRPGNVGTDQIRKGFAGSHLTLDASYFGVKYVYDLSVFIEHLFGEIKDVNYSKNAPPDLFSRTKKAAAIMLRGV